MLSEDEVKHIALLARVGLRQEEIATYQKDLSAVLDFFRELEHAVIENVEPIRQITGQEDVMRTDLQEDFGVANVAALKKNFPDTKNGFLKVRSVF